MFHRCQIYNDPAMHEDDPDDYDDEERRDRIGCEFPNECLMPGMHMISECHTVEMMHAYEDEQAEVY